MVLKSLRAQLLIWLMCPLIVVIALNAWIGYRNARETARSITDRLLLASAKAIAEQIKFGDSGLEALVPPVALEIFATDQKDHVAYAVVGPARTLLAGSSELADIARRPEGFEPTYWNATLKGEDVRLVALCQPLISDELGQVALVVVGETLHSYNKISDNIWRLDVYEQIVLVAFACGLAWLTQYRALRPLTRLSDELMDRDPGRLDPLSTNGLQSELQPVVVALNEALERVQRHVAVQRQFMADAAHQLRTPLALLRTQASVGRRESDLLAAQEAFEAVIATTDDMTRIANQLITLAMAETNHNQRTDSRVDLVDMSTRVVDQYQSLARDRGVGLTIDARVNEATIYGDASLLRELVVNLLDNSLKYTPAGGDVLVSIMADEATIMLRVDDSGIGIPREHWSRIFERFYRVLGTGVEGAGLGLSIVAEVARIHQADISFQSQEGKPGVSFHVRFPIVAEL